VIHPSSVPVSREARRAKTDRLDASMLMRALLGWLRGEPDCHPASPVRCWSSAKRSVFTSAFDTTRFSAAWNCCP
jgi:transposase